MHRRSLHAAAKQKNFRQEKSDLCFTREKIGRLSVRKAFGIHFRFFPCKELELGGFSPTSIEINAVLVPAWQCIYWILLLNLFCNFFDSQMEKDDSNSSYNASRLARKTVLFVYWFCSEKSDTVTDLLKKCYVPKKKSESIQT